jgi:hypothetical protein
MASFTKINDFVEHLAEGAHDLDTDQLTVALSNTAPSAEGSDPTTDGNGLLANVTEVSYTNCSTRNITLSSSSQTSGTYKLVLTDLTLTASGGSVGPFRYIYIYNDGTAVLVNPLICVYDYGSSITLNDGEQLNIDFDDANGLFQIA